VLDQLLPGVSISEAAVSNQAKSVRESFGCLNRISRRDRRCAGRDSVSNLIMPLPRPARVESHTADGSLRRYPAVLCLANRLSPLARTQRLDMGFATTRLVPALVDPDHYAMVDRKQPDYLFSEHYDRKLRERRIHRLGRFARLGNMLSHCGDMTASVRWHRSLANHGAHLVRVSAQRSPSQE
jgi:hypothetical protein